MPCLAQDLEAAVAIARGGLIPCAMVQPAGLAIS